MRSLGHETCDAEAVPKLQLKLYSGMRKHCACQWQFDFIRQWLGDRATFVASSLALWAMSFSIGIQNPAHDCVTMCKLVTQNLNAENLQVQCLLCMPHPMSMSIQPTVFETSAFFLY